MVILIIAVIIISILGSLLILPIRLIINTDQNYYLAGMPGIITISAIPDEALFHLKARVFFIPFKLKQEKIVRQRNKNLNKRKRKKTTSDSGSLYKNINLFRAFTKSIKIKQLDVNFDTNNPVSNALIGGLATPFFSDYKNINIDINYSGNYSASIFIQSRLILILIAFIKNK